MSKIKIGRYIIHRDNEGDDLYYVLIETFEKRYFFSKPVKQYHMVDVNGKRLKYDGRDEPMRGFETLGGAVKFVRRIMS